MDALLQLRLRQFDRRRRLDRAVTRLAPAACAGLGAAALLILLVRLGLPVAESFVPVLAAAGLLVPLLGLPRIWRTADDAADLAGRLDRAAGAEGLAMALAAHPDPAWAARLTPALDDLAPPPPRLAPLGPVALCALALLATALLPQRRPPDEPAMSPVARLLDVVAQRLQALDQAGALPPETAHDYAQRLDEVRATAEATGMQQTSWQALDRLAEALERDAAASARSLAEALAAAREADSAADPGTLDARLADLAAAAAALDQQAPGLLPQLSAEEAAALATLATEAARLGRLDPKALATLRARLGPGKAGKLTEAQLRALAAGMRRGLQEECRELAGICPGLDAEALTAACVSIGGDVGKGGVDRGPGHAALALNHQQAPTEAGTSADLPTGARLNNDGSVTLAESTRDAELDDAARVGLQRAQATAFSATAADARRTRVAPRHRGVVAGYFSAPVPATGTAPVRPPPSTPLPEIP